MKVDHYPYELPFQSAGQAESSIVRRGALLRVEFEKDSVGYADCHPWPEVGDEPLAVHLEALKGRQPTALAHCSLAFAYLDAQARRQGRSLLQSLIIPKSHYLIVQMDGWTPQHVQEVIGQGFTHVKVKVGRRPLQEPEELIRLFYGQPLQLRLDCNALLSERQFYSFSKKIEVLKPQIDFIEDPFPFHAKQWAAVQADGWTLACDRQVQLAYHQANSAQVLIFKPAIQPESEWRKAFEQRKIITTYLGHPLEQLSAAYAAAQIDPNGLERHGLLSHHVYRPNRFSKQLAQKGPTFAVPAGSGFGFDSDLAHLAWRSLP